ncbi:hypothetical protein NP493_342g00022 [Ridgeia piscesae]|uniref:SPRY domain-containing SOCS box protein 3 n=1 Tax=Ridgeia piscesae TaxID=27915 RepID=A0AAD9NUA8_RIDPI|nr:hypothetical protein NP493_342g00022 [Ridgeia piscesae]
MDSSGDGNSRRRSRRLAGLHPVVGLGDRDESGGDSVTDETRTMQTRNRRPYGRNTSRHRRRHHRTRIADTATSSRNTANHENANSRLLATESDGTKTQTQSERRPRVGAARMQPEPAEVAGTSAEVPRYRRMRLHVPRNPSHRYAAPVHGESYCDCPRQGRDVECKCGEEDNVLEWVWEKEFKASATELSDDRRDARFHVSYSSGTAAVRGTQSMSNCQYFWEIKMTTPVYGTDMMVGVGTRNVDLDGFRHTFCSLLGKDADSWGLSYYGRIQHKGRFQQVSGSRFGQGSIIGVHLDMWHGTLSFYKNRMPLGVAYRGLCGKMLYPMVSSTAARSGMRIIKASSFQTSLQFLCCQVLRTIVPSHLDVIDVLSFPPGLRAFLANNLSWLLRPSELSRKVTTQTKRKRAQSRGNSESSSDEEHGTKSRKQFHGNMSSDDDSDVDSAFYFLQM